MIAGRGPAEPTEVVLKFPETVFEMSWSLAVRALYLGGDGRSRVKRARNC